MKEVRSPKKPLIYYGLIVMAVLLLFNMLITPMIVQHRVKEVDYGTFVQMAEDKDLGLVEVDETENQVVFTNKEGTAIYKAGMIKPHAQLPHQLGAAHSPLLAAGLLYE